MTTHAQLRRNHDALDVVTDFLTVSTPGAWFQLAAEQLPMLLMDHANCEKKAASTALSMMYRYVEYPQLLQKMSSLAREELRHFEQVLELMTDHGIVYKQISSARYAQGLHQPDEVLLTAYGIILGPPLAVQSEERFYGLPGSYWQEVIEHGLLMRVRRVHAIDRRRRAFQRRGDRG